MYKNTNEKGITLVALVITIIVLLILAGLTISYISNGGIIDKTKIAMNNYEDADKKEQEMIDDINKKNKDEIELEPVYSEKGAEDNIAPQELFNYEIINDGSIAATYMDKLPTKTARITGIKPEYCNANGYDPINDVRNLNDTNYAIIYNGKRIEDVLVIPYQLQIDGEMYKVTEVDLSVVSLDALYGSRRSGAVFPDVKKIVYPNTVEKINIRDDYFISYDGTGSGISTKPQEFILSDNLTEIGDDTFTDCDDLRSIEIPDSVASIGGGAFYMCSLLESIEIPDSVTSIGDSAFYSCYSLEEIVIPDSVEYIGWAAFGGWAAYQTIYFECSEDESNNWDSNWKGNCKAKIVWDYQGE